MKISHVVISSVVLERFAVRLVVAVVMVALMLFSLALAFCLLCLFAILVKVLIVDGCGCMDVESESGLRSGVFKFSWSDFWRGLIFSAARELLWGSIRDTLRTKKYHRSHSDH